MPEATFAEERRMGIGGSDIAAVAGLSRWKTPAEVYAEKIGTYTVEENDAMRRGTALEPLLLAAYRLHKAVDIFEHPPLYRHPKYPWAIAHVDALAGNTIVEGKTSRNPWENDEAPQEHVCQVQWYMGVADKASADIVALILPDAALEILTQLLTVVEPDTLAAIVAPHLLIVPEPRDDTFIDALFLVGAEFWDRIERRDPPRATTTEGAKLLFPKSRAGSIECDPSLLAVVDEFLRFDRTSKDAASVIDHAKAIIQNFMGENDTLTIGGNPVLTWKSQDETRFNQARLQSENPAVFQAYRDSSSKRVMRIATKKEKPN